MGRGGERAKGEREGGARSVTLFAPSLGTRTSLPLPHRIENLSPISQTRKRRFREARQVAAARPTGSRSILSCRGQVVSDFHPAVHVLPPCPSGLAAPRKWWRVSEPQFPPLGDQAPSLPCCVQPEWALGASFPAVLRGSTMSLQGRHEAGVPVAL